MFRFGAKRTRSSRTATLQTVTLASRLAGVLRDRVIVIRLLMTVAALIGLVIGVRGWQTRFPYRIGDRVEQGIPARLKFRIINTSETERARRQRERLAPLVFRHDPEPLEAIPSRLRSHLGDVADAETVDQLSDEARAAFSLLADPDSPDRSPETLSQEFQTLKSAVSSGGDSVGSHIDDIAADFVEFLEPLSQFGVIDPRDLHRR